MDEYNIGLQQNGYGASQCNRLLDPRTSVELSSSDSLWRLYFERIDPFNLNQIVKTSIYRLQDSEINQFLTSKDFLMYMKF